MPRVVETAPCGWQRRAYVMNKYHGCLGFGDARSQGINGMTEFLEYSASLRPVVAFRRTMLIIQFEAMGDGFLVSLFFTAMQKFQMCSL